MIGPGRPAFYTGVRGMVYRRLTVRTAEGDAHSGLFGGAALNAVHALMTILAAVAPREGRLPTPLYAGLAPAGPGEVAAWAELPPGEEALAGAGLRPADVGAPDGFYMRTLASPSVDVHGLEAGEPAAVKTNIPGQARATLSLRVAPGQDAETLAATLDGLLREAAPAGADLTIEELGVARAAFIDPEHPVLLRRRRRPSSGPRAGGPRRSASAAPCRSSPPWPTGASPRSCPASACRTTPSTPRTSTCASSTSSSARSRPWRC